MHNEGIHCTKLLAGSKPQTRRDAYALTVRLGGRFGLGCLGLGGAGHREPAHELAEATVVVLQREVQHVANCGSVAEWAKPFGHGSIGGLHGRSRSDLGREQERAAQVGGSAGRGEESSSCSRTGASLQLAPRHGDGSVSGKMAANSDDSSSCSNAWSCAGGTPESTGTDTSLARDLVTIMPIPEESLTERERSAFGLVGTWRHVLYPLPALVGSSSFFSTRFVLPG